MIGRQFITLPAVLVRNPGLRIGIIALRSCRPTCRRPHSVAGVSFAVVGPGGGQVRKEINPAKIARTREIRLVPAHRTSRTFQSSTEPQHRTSACSRWIVSSVKRIWEQRDPLLGSYIMTNACPTPQARLKIAGLQEAPMPILLWYFPFIVFSAACDIAFSPPRVRKESGLL